MGANPTIRIVDKRLQGCGDRTYRKVVDIIAYTINRLDGINGRRRGWPVRDRCSLTLFRDLGMLNLPRRSLCPCKMILWPLGVCIIASEKGEVTICRMQWPLSSNTFGLL